MATVPVDTVRVERPGYVCVQLRLDVHDASDGAVVDIDALTVSSPSASPSLAFVKPSDDAVYGRRGPQVTLWYDLPRGNQEWLYSEVTVPAGQDCPGTCYETNGCGEALPTPSVSPRCLSATACTSRRKRGTHAAGSCTWRLVACWRRPAASTWITGPYAFLENFYPREGWRDRLALYGNQWWRDSAGRWREITSGLVGIDTTGRSQARRDFTASVRGRWFVIEAFGFFDRTIVPETRLTRQPNGRWRDAQPAGGCVLHPCLPAAVVQDDGGMPNGPDGSVALGWDGQAATVERAFLAAGPLGPTGNA